MFVHWLCVVVITAAGLSDRVSCCFKSDAGLRCLSPDGVAVDITGVVGW